VLAHQATNLLCASRSEAISSIIFRYVLVSSRRTVRGSTSPNTGLMRAAIAAEGFADRAEDER
jgi:hypothetical protein